ncbi:MAG TPA: hypothetical protein PL163_21105, partial [Leptospiraceae bacterium]|nr:hypothetical protein [Leptospiraceae bacterium]
MKKLPKKPIQKLRTEEEKSSFLRHFPLLLHLQSGLRFLWMPEMTGTYAYLASHPQRLPRMVAGLNLDMVGADQDAVGSVSLIDAPPEALASFTPDLLERLRAEFTQETTSFGGHGGYALFR